MNKFIMALDAGTTSTMAILFDKDSNIVSASQQEFTQYYPKSGWVEHDTMEILAATIEVSRDVIQRAGISEEQVSAIGIREKPLLYGTRIQESLYIMLLCGSAEELRKSVKSLKKKGWQVYLEKKRGLCLMHTFLRPS